MNRDKKVHLVEDIRGRNNEKKVKIEQEAPTEYDGYKILENDTAIDVLEVPKTLDEIESFFEDYVAARKPCKIRGISPEQFPLKELQPNVMKGTLPSEEILTIEKKSDGGYGSGSKRIKMSFGQFMGRILDQHDTDLYLTTQYYEDDPNNSDYSTDEEEASHVLDDVDNFDNSSLTFDDLHDDFDDLEENGENEGHEIDSNEDGKKNDEDEEELESRLRELYQPPMTNLVRTLPECPGFLRYLIPQQINLWVGAVRNAADDTGWLKNFDVEHSGGKLGLGRNVPGGGSSSGLHHDHADNIYIPVNGHKRFTLFSPHDAAKMYTVGDIRKVHSSGVIDYHANDRAPLWRELRDDGAIVAEVYKKILGGESECSPEERLLYEEFIKKDSEQQARKANKTLDPPSFSTVPTAVVQIDEIEDENTRENIRNASMKKWPLFFQANRLTVDVKPGEMLFLPTGWFHEVTSFGNQSDHDIVNVAANYWFIPPNGRSINNVYSHTDNYWPDDYKITQSALAKARSTNNLPELAHD
ncbi:hypothetical protein HG535_0E02410 [Zygotorulaspora mrakii]|uniref:JmjC domain-containing protein n=1 Tax=Zygotorulaspora mrakii TaxID=42260 RepID=A0A7H9B3T8_ZYGMR|nr:uncharacterized protein HG535_0E02410 [Zygotorulaspora mrakii]QLG73157.1 hypothetical protein HG535_0E02410 [Zygotorulaspora mrakii]